MLSIIYNGLNLQGMYYLTIIHVDVVPLYNGYFGEGAGAILLDDVRCIGNESQLVECTAETLDNCDHSEDAGVRCGSKLTCYSIILY